MDPKKQTRTSTLLSVLLCIFFLSMSAGCPHNKSSPQSRQLSYAITNSYPHDPGAYTQGLEWDNGTVYESTGRYGFSSLRKVDYKTGTVEVQIDYSKEIFAESVTVLDDRIYQLSWENHLIFIYDKHDLSLLKTQKYKREGWGITNDGEQLIASDGTAMLYFLDPLTLAENKRITVMDNFQPVRNINDLEYVEGRVFANIYQSDSVAIINPENGVVDAWLDFSRLRALVNSETKVKELNGIMYDEVHERLYVTGKHWPKLFEIKVGH